MQSLGIDLSTDPRKVWACEIDWEASPPRVVALDRLSEAIDPLSGGAEPGAPPARPIRDEAGLIAGLIERIERFGPAAGRVVGIDAPFGWPVAFIDAISDWQDGDLRGFRKRSELRLRATDRFVQMASGLTPMSVSADRIGSTAMLCAEVLSSLAHREDRPRHDRARAADGLAEVYPAAALRQWTDDRGAPLTTGGYKVGFLARETLLRELIGLTEGDQPTDPFALASTGQEASLGAAGVAVAPADIDRMIESDDALDAFVCALVARAIGLGRCFTVDGPAEPEALWHAALAEGPAGLTTAQAERQAGRTEAARAVQSEALEVAEAEGWIHIPHRGPLRGAVGLEPVV